MASIQVDNLTGVTSGFAGTLLSTARAHAGTAIGRIGSVPLWFGNFQNAQGGGAGEGFPAESVKADAATVGQGTGSVDVPSGSW